MERIFPIAAAERGLGFLTLDPVDAQITWHAETARTLGEHAAEEAGLLREKLTSPLRRYLLEGASKEAGRCVVPLAGRICELVLLPGNPGDVRAGYFFPYPVHEPMELMKKFFLSNSSNKLRSLLNSVIIASDVVANAGADAVRTHTRFLALMAEDAREVNTLLNREGEIIDLSLAGGAHADEALDTRAILDSIHVNLQYLAEDSSIALNLALPDNLPPLRGSYTVHVLAYFLAVHHALSRTSPLGEILITAHEDREGWALELCFADADLPADLAIDPARYGIAPVRITGWSEGAQLQLIDSLVGLHGGELQALSGETGLGYLRLPIAHA